MCAYHLHYVANTERAAGKKPLGGNYAIVINTLIKNCGANRLTLLMNKVLLLSKELPINQLHLSMESITWINLYAMFRRSIMEYGSVAWMGAADSHLSKLDS